MISNRKVYDEAYERALAGHSPTVWQRITAIFEDEYTRQSRVKGEHDGIEARAAQQASQAPAEESAAAAPSVEA
jgi:hypothetical protein